MKVKEKQQSGDVEVQEETVNLKPPANEPLCNISDGNHSKLHVEFKEPAVVESEKENIPTQTKVRIK